MGSFGRSLKRGAAKNAGLLRTQGQQARLAMKARRAWCPKCERVCDSWAELVWSKPEPGKKIKTLLCRRCETAVVHRDLVDLPPGTTEKGLWLRPGPGGWAAQEARAREEARCGTTGAGQDGSAGGEPGADVAEGIRVDAGGSGETDRHGLYEHQPGGVGASPAIAGNAPAAGAGAQRVGRRSRGG